jgi:hypothetical protein
MYHAKSPPCFIPNLEITQRLTVSLHVSYDANGMLAIYADYWTKVLYMLTVGSHIKKFPTFHEHESLFQR